MRLYKRKFPDMLLVQAFPNFNSLDSRDNPRLEEAVLESQAMRAAAAKARLLQKKNDLASHLNAASSFDLSFVVADMLRSTHSNDEDKFALAASNRDVYNDAARNLWRIWQDTKDSVALARLFRVVEGTKAKALEDALQLQRALALGGIPDTLLALEKRLRIEAASAAEKWNNLKLSSDTTGLSDVNKSAFEKRKVHNDFIEALEKQYPQFGQFSRAGLRADLPSIQAVIPDTTVLLSWFDAGDRHLCIMLRRHGLSAFEVLRDSLFNNTLSEFIDILQDKTQQESNFSGYFLKAYSLFQNLFPEEALQNVRSLIIIPDGQLCYLPFEALLTAPYSGDYAHAPYLLRSQTVQYAWSATLLTLPSATYPGDKSFLQIAPFPKIGRDKLPALPNSLSDAPGNLIVKMLDNENATASNFFYQSPQYRILHFSTHADAGDRSVPSIELYDRRLTISEIYVQTFHASLVSLSACETGKGRFSGGEGMLSLARAFAYAGAQSLIASYWKVNERSTAELFSVFYENLQAGRPKAESLRQAKLAYLLSDELDARKSPFYWAAFTFTGKDGTVVLEKNNSKQWLLAGIPLLLAILFFWRHSIRAKKKINN